MIEKRNCEKHGYVEYIIERSKNRSWYSCRLCKRERNRKASAKYRTKPGIREYHKEYSKQVYNIKNTLSVYLTMILLASNIKPE